MANFKGHALPGSFFFLLGLWWSVKCSLKYHSRKVNRNGRLHRYLNHMEALEGALKIFCSTVGILAEQFVPDGPHLHLYGGDPPSWVKLMNWQHSTMYFFFCITGVVDLLTYYCQDKVPEGLNHLMLSLAFFVEGFLFYFHVTNRPMLDKHVHILLLTAIFGGAISTVLEVFQRDRMILGLFSSSIAILQGTWFWQIGFVLYPPGGGPEWNLQDHSNVMFVTMCFCWHFAVAIFLVATSYTLVHCCMLKKHEGQVELGLRIRKKQDEKSCHAALLNGVDEE